MALTMDLCKIDNTVLIPLNKKTLDLEHRLERWIEQDISLLGIDALIIDRQVHTDYGGYIDLLAINSDGELVVIELKRNKTPRDIVAQCLDYGSWVDALNYESISSLYDSYSKGDFDKDFAKYFGTPVPEKINTSYQIMVVAASLDESTEGIVQHLNDCYSVNINVVFFNIFEKDGVEYVGRSWLKDPDYVEEKSSKGTRSKWTGYYFVNTGMADDNARDWDLNRKYHFISAGGGPVGSMLLKSLKKVIKYSRW